MAHPLSIIDYADMPREAWRRLAAAADDPAHPMRLLVAASIDKHRPAARMLVLRGASRDAAALWFHSDARSAKIAQWRANPAMCAIAYDPRDGVQLRLDGSAVIHVGDRLTDHHWAQTDIAVRYAYALSHPPGEALPEGDPRSRSHHQRLQEGRSDLGQENFAVIEMIVDSIEWFQTTTASQCRARMTAATHWSCVPLTP